MTIDKVLKCEDLNKEAEEVQHLAKAPKIIKRYEGINKTKNKGIINVAYHQGQVFKKFKEKEKFAKLATIIFKINIFKLCNKYPKLLKSSIGLELFTSYH